MDNSEPLTAPSPISDSGLRGYALRRGYRVRKLRGKDRYALRGLLTGDTTVANERCVDLADCYFSKNQIVEYLRTEPLRKVSDGEGA